MDFQIPKELQDYLGELDRFIEAEIKPLEQRDDNIRFFDHRREHARTDWDNNGLPRPEREAITEGSEEIQMRKVGAPRKDDRRAPWDAIGV